jgi:hypothetical protein
MEEKELDMIINLIPTATYDQVRVISGQLKIHREMLNKQSISKFKVFDKVTFEHNNENIEGTITKIKIKRIAVNTNRGNWDVPANMLTLVN